MLVRVVTKQNRLRKNWVLVIGLVIYALGFFVFYPRIPAIVDENAYLTQSLLFKSGKLSYDDSTIPVPILSFDQRAHGGHIVNKYPPGNALLILPFLFIHWRAVFLLGLLCAIVGTVIFARLMQRVIPDAFTGWALLLLYYPPVLVYSRTVMSDLPATVAVLAAFYLLFFHRSSGLFLAGMIFGLGCLIRYTNIILLLPFIIILWLNRQNWKSLVVFGGGVIPWLLIILIYNRYGFGSFWKVPMWQNDYFSLRFIPGHLIYYLLPLLVWYPLLIVGPFFAPRNWRVKLLLPFVVLLLFFSAFSYTPAVQRISEQMVVGLRYLMPVLPLLILGYAIGWERVRRAAAMIPNWFFTVGILSLCFIGTLIQWRHHRYLLVQEYCARQLLVVIPEQSMVFGNKDVIELFNIAWGWRNWLPYDSLNPGRLPPELPAYLAVIKRGSEQEPGVDTTMLKDFPGHRPVFHIDKPCHILVWQLR